MNQRQPKRCSDLCFIFIATNFCRLRTPNGVNEDCTIPVAAQPLQFKLVCKPGFLRINGNCDPDDGTWF